MPVMYFIYINDMGNAKSSVSLFAEDAKIMWRVEAEEDWKMVQVDINRIHEWNQKWEIKFDGEMQTTESCQKYFKVYHNVIQWGLKKLQSKR